MKELIKTINGKFCDIFAISHYKRISVGEAKPEIKIYEESVNIICPNPKMERCITDEVLNGLTVFDLFVLLPSKDDVFIPFTWSGITNVDISPDEWVFEITDAETVKQLLAL